MLNDQQKKAVKATNGRVLILAGAGSGKTTVLINRIAHLIGNLGVDPKNILGLTFTNKAAREMRDRLAKMIPKKLAESVTLCTFHSFCFHLLKKEIHHLGYTSEFSIYDDRDIKRLLEGIAGQFVTGDDEMPPIGNTMEDLKRARSHSGFLEKKDKKEATYLKDLIQGLSESLKAYNALDFDSLITLTLQLFENFPDVLKTYQEQFRYVMIDEYQDTNPTQYKLANLIAAPEFNLCVVGDDDQAIYSWRGADVRHILEFQHDTLIKLEQNYRSTPNILDGANAVIKNNSERHDKSLWSVNDLGDHIHVFNAPDEPGEAEAVVQRMLQLKKQGFNWSDMAILYRSNILARPFEMTLLKTVWDRHGSYVRGIPYHIVSGTEFYQRAEVKDLHAYMKFITNPKDQTALLRIINYPRRGISTKTLDQLTSYQRANKLALWDVLQNPSAINLTPQAEKGIALFVGLMNEAMYNFETLPLRDALQKLIDSIGYKETILSEVKSEKAQQFKWENVKQCLDMLHDYEEESENPSLHDFLSTCLLDVDKQLHDKKVSEDRVQLMTFHASKGLEFPVCFLVGLEDHILPHEKSLADTGLEEERRLFYVALTRAKKCLTLSMSRSRKNRGSDKATNPSRFLFEIPQEKLKVSEWNFPHPYEV